MGLYAIGDIQGCLRAFDALLEALGFDPARDHLVLVGDLVNRGPDSEGVLRRVVSLGEAVSCVLGNHDLNTLAIATGARAAKPKDTVSGLLASRRADSLLDWLRHRPLVVERDGYLFCHAGVHPAWNRETTLHCAREVEAALRGPDYGELLARMYGSEPDTWDKELAGYDRLRFIINVFTRMRYVSTTGALDLLDTGPPGTQRPGLLPWFEAPRRRELGRTVVFGHWSSLGYYTDGGVVSLDTGCVWGRYLTAVRLDAASVTPWQVRCKES